MDASIIAYSAQKNLFDRLEVVSNNVANANTTGYRGDFAVYLKAAANKPIPSMKVATNLAQGGLRATNRQLDVAIQGDGYFQVDTPLGPRFTRAGTFTTNAEGALVTSEGFEVQGAGGNIALQPDDSTLRIGDDGTIVAVTPTGDEERGQLGVFRFEDKSTLVKTGGAYFSSTSDPEQAQVLVDYKIAQGMTEDSNVDSVSQMTEMIDISRSVQNLAKIIQDQHQLMRSAVQRITAKA